MAVSLKEADSLQAIPGIRLSACSAGIYSKNRDDMALIELPESSSCAGVFTKNSFAAAPVKLAKENLGSGTPRYLLINAGNANAATGERGYSDARELCKTLSVQAACEESQVLPFSTGVIGEFLPVDSMKKAIKPLLSTLEDDHWLDVARAIMTTDTVAKGANRTLTIGKDQIYVTGIAKGSGMIQPDMATMLAFLATNASVENLVLEKILENAVNDSFNRISVDGDTSTNDACILVASGHSKQNISDLNTPETAALQEAVTDLCRELAQSIVRDGEGASKFITVVVKGGQSNHQSLSVAYDIANSPLVKTAMFASDPNWGRIIMAIGGSRGGEIVPEKTSVYLNSLCIVDKGEKSEGYTEELGQKEMAATEIVINVDLGLGNCVEKVWTCDLSHDYVRINAEYRS
ncbi:MAG: bifunctional glutamate N-acetyltransferase/amino-acid acetyltransferase ArgJ [Gammaproteobacteria bacterium]|nr:bifunctional glutamate N-acetyltransferase/amino-acid acetyltransferase ArgJ [Gammaproteobacteria bacterium]